MNESELKTSFDNLQSEANKLYEAYGATDNIIGLQVSINKLRHEHNLCDKSECLHEEYVQ